MDGAVSHARAPQVPGRALGAFLLITFGLSWGIFALFILLPAPMTALFGPVSGWHPLFVLAVHAPAIAACMLVVRHGGLAGLRRYLSRLLLWRCGWGWYGFLLVGVPLLFYGGAALKGSVGTELSRFATWQSLAAALAITLIIGPVGRSWAGGGWRYRCCSAASLPSGPG